MLCVCVGDVMDVVFSVCIVSRVLCCQTALTNRISFVVPPYLSLFLATCESCM